MKLGVGKALLVAALLLFVVGRILGTESAAIAVPFAFCLFAGLALYAVGKWEQRRA